MNNLIDIILIIYHKPLTTMPSNVKLRRNNSCIKKQKTKTCEEVKPKLSLRSVQCLLYSLHEQQYIDLNNDTNLSNRLFISSHAIRSRVFPQFPRIISLLEIIFPHCLAVKIFRQNSDPIEIGSATLTFLISCRLRSASKFVNRAEQSKSTNPSFII